MVIVRIWEGLGNQMFQYAFAKSYQIKRKKKVLLECERAYNQSLPKAQISDVSREYMLDAFQISLDKKDIRKDKKWSFLERDTVWKKMLFCLSQVGLYPYRYVLDKDARAYYKKYYFYNHCYFMGWFQNEAYFRDIRKELLRDFRPRKKIKVSKEFREILLHRNTVALHVRRGDYRKMGLDLNLSYYRSAIQYVNKHVENPVYIIFSDDIKWVKEKLSIGAETYTISDFGQFADYEELLLMSYCKHNIIANSTFSWWGAWLNRNQNKIVVAPKNWTGSEKSKKIIPQEWVKV